MLRKDMMLLVSSVAPFMIGLIFRFGIPQIEKLLEHVLSMDTVLIPYYKIFDMFLAMITPFFYCFVAAMVVLEERDEHLINALIASPLKKSGYFISRILLPGVIAMVITAVLLPFCTLTTVGLVEYIGMLIMGTLQGIIFALMIISFSSNKLEGVAVTKLSSIIMVGCIVPCFVPKSLQYIFAFLPSFWIGKASWNQQNQATVVAIVLSAIWIYILNYSNFALE